MRYKLTWTLIALNVLIFLIVFSMPQELLNPVFGALSFSAATSGEAWRWFTSLFLHVSASHLFFNMLALYFFGKVLEEEAGRWWFLSVYFVAGLLGNLLFMSTSVEAVAGASGCTFGLMGAAMLLKPFKKIHLYVFPLPLGIVAIILIIIETLAVFFKLPALAVDGVAHIAHVGGLLTGAVFGFFYSPKQATKGVLLLVVCLVLLLILAPLLGLATSIGAIILGFIDQIIGFFLYNMAGLLSFLWV